MGETGPPRSEQSLESQVTDEATASSRSRQRCEPGEDAMMCERCGKGEMYRMHAVWRCPECGFKTDCCGW